MENMQVDLRGKVALISGAAGGIGRGLSQVFARNGAVVLVNDIDASGGPALVEAIRAGGGQGAFYKADVSDQAQVQEMVAQIIEEFSKIDILINNAGINIAMKDRGPIHQFPDEMWHKILAVDLDGVYFCSKAVLEHMTSTGYGKIINIASIVGAVPLRNQSAFAAAKAGVINLTRAMAIELAPFGVNVNAILPGSINIPTMTTSGMYTDGRLESILSHIPLKRPGTPEDIAYGALYLASEAASYVTGSTLTIDGGWTCGFARDW